MRNTTAHLSDLLDQGDLRPVTQIARLITGRRPSPSTVWRWCMKGTRAGRLPATPLYGSWHTTEAAFRAWLRAGTTAALDTSNASTAGTDDDALRADGLL